jgi:transposase InsO family protein
MQDRRCRFGLAARIEMVRRRQAGESFRAIARSLACSPNTVRTAWQRWQQADEAARADWSCLAPRRPLPKSCPWALGPEVEQRIVDARQRTNWGPMRLAVIVGRHRATVWKVLKRRGLSRRRKSGRQTFRRFEWSQPGALLHIDAYSAPKFASPGHRWHGDRSKIGRQGGQGKTVVVAVQDDHTRLVYAELHSAENAANVAITLKRGARWMREQGLGPVEAVMSDNAYCYTKSPRFQTLLDELGARHIRIPPYTPRWNGKLERFFGTLEDEWAHAREWPNSATRDRALSSFIRYFNRYRPHSAAGGRAPITRVQQV